MANDADLPEELIEKLATFEQEFDNMNNTLEPLINMDVNSPAIELDPLDRARLLLLQGYYLNTLFWIYLKTLGIDPRKHKIKEELDRYKPFFDRIKEISAAGKNAGNLDKDLSTPKESETQNASSSVIEEITLDSPNSIEEITLDSPNSVEEIVVVASSSSKRSSGKMKKIKRKRQSP